MQLYTGCTLNYALGTGSGEDGLVTVNSQLGLVAGVVVNITPGADWGNGMYPLFNLPNISYPHSDHPRPGWTILGANLGGHIYSLVATGNDVDLDVQAVNGAVGGVGRRRVHLGLRRQLARRHRPGRRRRHGPARRGCGRRHGDDHPGRRAKP